MKSEPKFEMINVDLIDRSPYQPRLTFNLEDIRGSIKKYGIRDPLKVRIVKSRFELIDGERRWRVAKEEDIKIVPCFIEEYSDEEADAMAWRFNTEREGYTLEERATHFKQHQDQGMSGRAIALIHGQSHQVVLCYLEIFQLPEKYQKLLWAGELTFVNYRYLWESGLFKSEGGPMGPQKIEQGIFDMLDQSIERRLTYTEFTKLVNDYNEELARKQIESATNAVTRVQTSQNRVDNAKDEVTQPETKELQTSSDFEAASKSLKDEAKKRETPEEVKTKKIENANKKLSTGKGNIISSIKKARKMDIPVDDFTDRVSQIKSKIGSNPEEALEDIKELKDAISNAIEERQKEIEKQQREEQERKIRLEEQKKAEKAKKELEEKLRIESMERERKAREEEQRKAKEREEQTKKEADEREKKIKEDANKKAEEKLRKDQDFKKKIIDEAKQEEVQEMLKQAKTELPPEFFKGIEIKKGQWVIDYIQGPLERMSIIKSEWFGELNDEQIKFLESLFEKFESKIKEWRTILKNHSQVIDIDKSSQFGVERAKLTDREK